MPLAVMLGRVDNTTQKQTSYVATVRDEPCRADLTLGSAMLSSLLFVITLSESTYTTIKNNLQNIKCATQNLPECYTCHSKCKFFEFNSFTSLKFNIVPDEQF